MSGGASDAGWAMSLSAGGCTGGSACCEGSCAGFAAKWGGFAASSCTAASGACSVLPGLPPSSDTADPGSEDCACTTQCQLHSLGCFPDGSVLSSLSSFQSIEDQYHLCIMVQAFKVCLLTAAMACTSLWLQSAATASITADIAAEVCGQATAGTDLRRGGCRRLLGKATRLCLAPLLSRACLQPGNIKKLLLACWMVEMGAASEPGCILGAAASQQAVYRRRAYGLLAVLPAGAKDYALNAKGAGS